MAKKKDKLTKSGKKIIKEQIHIYDTYGIRELISGPVPEIITRLSELDKDLTKSGYSGYEIVIEQMYDDVEFSLIGEREETDKEFEVRKKREAAAARAKITRLEKSIEKRARKDLEERVLYEKLKEKYDKKES